MFPVSSGMNAFFTSAFAGASFAVLAVLRDAVLASLFAIHAVLVHKIIIEGMR